MGGILAELGNNKVISAELTVKLRNYIASKDPAASPFMRAKMFADAVNRIVDGRMPGFGRELAGRLKDSLFREIAYKPVFSINCADIFKSAVKLDSPEYELLGQLTGWLSGVLERPADAGILSEMVVRVRKLMAEKPDDDIADIIDAVEESTGGLKYAEQDSVSAAAEPGIEAAAPGNESAIKAENDFTCDNGGDSIPGCGPDGAALENAGILGVLRENIKSREHKRALAASGFAAAALTLLLFTGSITGATSKGGNEDIAAPLPVSGQYYFSATDINRDIFSESLPAVKPDGRRMRATAYDLSVESCGKRPGQPQYGITNSGTKATVGRTVAVDPEVIPLGSRLLISFPGEYSGLDGVYVAEDTGRLIKGDSIDIFFGEDKEGSREIYKSAMKFGVRYVNVKVLD